MSERKTVTVEVFYEVAEEEWPLDDFALMVSEWQKAVPPEFLSTAVVALEGDYDETSKLTVRFQRPETDEDIAKREQEADSYRRQQEVIEQAQYRRLKAKFEGG